MGHRDSVSGPIIAFNVKLIYIPLSENRQFWTTSMPQVATTGSFKPGQTGNPGGRPRAATQMTWHARAYAEEAIRALVKTMRTETGAARIAAARELLDRAFGRVAQNVDFTVSKKLNELNLDELAALEAQVVGLAAATASLEPPQQHQLFDDAAVDPELGAPVTIDGD